jgi:hydroxymethylpyrimidine pyrophosphatase-like HAD family hydrolase
MMRIGAILSDYDGTLCPADSVRGNSDSNIPPKLEKILWDISKEIPICIVSSKDFFFLHDKTKFAKVVSCMMGIETLVLKKHHYSKSLSGKKKKKIDSFDGKYTNGALLDKIKDDINDSYTKGKISEHHYKLLNEKLSDNKNNQQSNNHQAAPPSKRSILTSTTQGSPIKS